MRAGFLHHMGVEGRYLQVSFYTCVGGYTLAEYHHLEPRNDWYGMVTSIRTTLHFTLLHIQYIDRRGLVGSDAAAAAVLGRVLLYTWITKVGGAPPFHA
jgi:hypothetical protein